MEIKKLDVFPDIKPESEVRVKTTGHITEIMYQDKRPIGSPIRRLDRDNYVDIRTGEVGQFDHKETRADDLASVARSLVMGRDLINSNVDDVSRCRWVTLTYADNMTDPKRLKRDFDQFNKLMRRTYGHYEYITAAEPQGRGAWHLHVLMIFPSKAPFLPNDVVRDKWGQGFVSIKPLDSIDNVGAYLTAYLGDIDINQSFNPQYCETTSIKAVGDKRYIKGGRLPMYPSGMHIFRWSKGIKKPDVVRMQYVQAKEKVSADTLTYVKAVEVSDSERDFKTVLNYEYFNSRRPKNQEFVKPIFEDL